MVFSVGLVERGETKRNHKASVTSPNKTQHNEAHGEKSRWVTGDVGGCGCLADESGGRRVSQDRGEGEGALETVSCLGREDRNLQPRRRRGREVK